MRRILAALALLPCVAVWPAPQVTLAIGGAALVGRHPGYDEPLDSPPILFASGGVEIGFEETSAACDVSAGWSGGWVDSEAVLSLRHRLEVDWGPFLPYLDAGLGWAGRFAPDGGGLSRTALFPQAGLGLEVRAGAFGARAAVSYRPAPVRLPFAAIEPVALRRIAFRLLAEWTVLPGGGR